MQHRGSLIYVLLLFGIIAGCGVGGYVVASRLSNDMVTALSVTVAILAIVTVVGLILILNNAMVARSVWNQVKLLDQLRGQRPPSVNIRMPDLPAQSSQGTNLYLPTGDLYPYNRPPGEAGYPTVGPPGYRQSPAFRDLTGGDEALDIE